MTRPPAWNPAPEKFCEHCHTWKPVKGGEYVKYNGGLNQRWKCGGCLAKKREREAAEAKQ